MAQQAPHSGATIKSAFGLIARHSGGTEAGEKAPKAREDLPHFIATDGADHEIALIFG